jgi:hypothetical protein
MCVPREPFVLSPTSVLDLAYEVNICPCMRPQSLKYECKVWLDPHLVHDKFGREAVNSLSVHTHRPSCSGICVEKSARQVLWDEDTTHRPSRHISTARSSEEKIHSNWGYQRLSFSLRKRQPLDCVGKHLGHRAFRASKKCCAGNYEDRR